MYKYNKNTVKTVITMAFPAIMESFFGTFVALVDSYMVSGLGSAAVAAIGLTTQPKFVGLAIFFALNVAISALVARRLGEGKRESANSILLTSFVLIIGLVIIISTLTVVFAPEIMIWCGSEQETHAQAVTYYRIVMGGMIFNCIQLGINSAQRGAGNTKITMRTNMTSNIINVIFNYLLIGGHLGFPALGIAGAAVATVLGTVVSSVMSIVSIMNPDGFVSIPYIVKNRIMPSVRALRDIIKVGYSIFFEQLLMRVGFIATALMAASQGTAAMAAHQVVMNLMGMSFSFGDGLQTASVALIGRSLGGGEPERAKEYGKVCQLIGGIISVGLAFAYFFGAKPLMNAFFEETEIVEIGVNIMCLVIVIVLFQVRQVVYMGCLRGAGDTLYTAITIMIATTIIRTVVSYICCYSFGWGIIGIWMGVLGDQICRYVCAMLRFKAGKWVKIKI